MRRAIPTTLAAVVLAIAGCGEASDASADEQLVVFAAASLTDAFEEVAAEFEGDHSGRSVELNFAGSSALREQILEGAPADVFASANGPTMEAVVDAGEAAEPIDFVRNRLEIAVPAGNSAGVTGLADFARDELLLGLCAAEVPCGSAGREALAGAGVTPAPDTEEPDVRALLAKVASGDLDAGLVYRTDVLAAGDGVEGVPIPDADNVVVAFPIAVLTRSTAPDLAEAFVAFVRSERGQAILAAHGFEAP